MMAAVPNRRSVRLRDLSQRYNSSRTSSGIPSASNSSNTGSHYTETVDGDSSSVHGQNQAASMPQDGETSRSLSYTFAHVGRISLPILQGISVDSDIDHIYVNPRKL